MNTDDPLGGRSKPDDVRTDADIVRLQPVSRKNQYLGVYTDRWKELCREILRAYSELEGGSVGVRLGATNLRKRIMERHNVGKDEFLSHHNLYDWLYRDKGHTDDVTFSYIDEFVRSIQFGDERYDAVKAKIIDHRDFEVRKNLADLYLQTSLNEGEISSYFQEVLDKVLYSEIDGFDFSHLSLRQYPPYQHAAMYVHTPKQSMLGVKILYSFHPFSVFKTAGDVSINTIAYHGYILPTGLAHLSVGGSDPGGVILAFRRQRRGIEIDTPHTFAKFRLGIGNMSLDWASGIVYPNDLALRNMFTSLGHPKGEDIKPHITDFGEATFSEPPSNFDVIKDYMKSLTDEYLLW